MVRYSTTNTTTKLNDVKNKCKEISPRTSSLIQSQFSSADVFINNSNSSSKVKPPFWGGFLLSFKGGVDIRKLWVKGLLPTVKNGFYGDILTLENVTREHLLPKSQGGKKVFNNIVLASAVKNQARSSSDISLFADKEIVKKYLEQFKDIKLQRFDGKKYIEAVIKTLQSLGFNL